MRQWHNATVAQSQNCPFAVNTTISFKNVTATSGNNGIWRGIFRAKKDAGTVVGSSYIFGLNLSTKSK
jgi:hypothetical protein